MWTKAGDLSEKVKGPVQIYGLIALGGASLLVIFSLVRKKHWSLFTYTHWVGFTVFIIGVSP
jgi:hypothetical protein